MAVFNPQIPDTQDPNWLGWSKPITQPEGDKSTGVALSTFGEGVGDALKLADTSFKSIIEDKVYTAAKEEQDRYTQSLKSADAAIRTKQTSTSSTGASLTDAGQNVNLLTTNTAPTPATPFDLKNLPFQVDGLGNARANGKLSETDYYMRLDALAKDFRARYPGYKEFIDHSIEKTTGVNPANKAIGSLLQDINSWGSAANKERNDAIHLLTRDDVAANDGSGRARQALQKVMKGEWTPAQGTDVAMELLGQKGELNELERKVKMQEASEKGTSLLATKWAQRTAAIGVYNSIQNLTIDASGTPQKFVDFVKEHAPGSGKIISDTQWKDAAQITEFNMMQVEQQLRDRFDVPIFEIRGVSDKVSFTQLVGRDKVNAMINEELKWHKDLVTAVKNKDTGLMHQTAFANKAVLDGTVANVFKEWPGMALVGAYHQIGGPNWVSEQASNIAKLSLGPVDKDQLDAVTKKVLVQPGLRIYNPTSGTFGPTTSTGTPYTLREALKDVQFRHDNPTIASGSGDTQLNLKIAQLPKEIANPKLSDEGKIGLIQATFSKENRGMIDQIQPDGTTRDGKPITGKSYIFSSITDPSILKEVKRLDQANPEKNLWNQTKDWIGQTFAQELYHKDIVSLNTIQAHPDFKISYVVGKDGIPQFKVDEGVGINTRNMRPPLNPGSDVAGYYSSVNQNSLAQARATIFRLNDGLRSVANTYVADGKDPRPYVLNLLTGTGFRPTPGSIPEEMFRAVETEAAGFTGRVLPYNEESEGVPSSGNIAPNAQRGSLSEFLAAPGRGVASPLRNAPVVNSGRSRGTPPRRSINLSDQGPITGIETTNVPTGADLNQYLRNR